MKAVNFFIGLLTVLIIGLLFVYFFIPFNTIEFNSNSPSGNSNFSLDSNSSMQFYKNMRYSGKEISYMISDDCSLKKKNDMALAFEIISNVTILEFYPVLFGEEISVTCSDKDIYEGDAFIGGEGGVTNVTIVDGFHVILNGQILLIRDSQCANPNIATHELFHALGFDHSSNPNNIMYDTADCGQTIGDDIPDFIDGIYSIPSAPDLVFENVSAVMNGKYLDAVVDLRNSGFADAGSSNLIISADGKEIKTFEISSLDIGYGRKITLSNLWVGQISVDEIEFYIESDFDELDKTNNLFVLNVKK